jgi:hypothetical protein
MRKWIGIFTAFAFVLTMAFPPMASAMPANGAKALQAQMPACHQLEAGAATEKSAHNDKCCNKGTCKCPMGSCNGSMAKWLNQSPDILLLPSIGKNEFSFASPSTVSALPERLKRPPKA